MSTQIAEETLANLTPILEKTFGHCDIYFSSRRIRIGSEISRRQYWKGALENTPGSLCAIYPNLERLITRDWWISLKTFSFQWIVQSSDDNEILLTLGKIFDRTSQLPNLETFAWEIESNWHILVMSAINSVGNCVVGSLLFFSLSCLWGVCHCTVLGNGAESPLLFSRLVWKRHSTGDRINFYCTPS